jgi:Rrf2 family protein
VEVAMLFSRACEHAIRTILFVAVHSGGRPLTIEAIARELDVPSSALAKVVQTLTRHGLLVSRRGPGGGILLGRSAGQITILEIAQLVDGPDLAQRCILGLPGCSEEGEHCPLHDRWGRIRDRIVKTLASPSIAGLAQRLKDERHVLTRSTRTASEATAGSLGARGGAP